MRRLETVSMSRTLQFEEFLKQERPRWPLRRVEYVMRDYFGEEPLDGACVLEIGSGMGVFCAWLACAGVRRVVGLEPELSGSHDGMLAAAQRLFNLLDVRDVVELRPERLQEYLLHATPGSFTHILMHNVINHLDESATSQLHDPTAEVARRNYRQLLEGVYGLLQPDGLVIVSDCARRNFWSLLGLPSPFAPSIQWGKHQQPSVWAELFTTVGFKVTRIAWNVPWQLRIFRPLLGNQFGAYFLSSYFTLFAYRPK